MKYGWIFAILMSILFIFKTVETNEKIEQMKKELADIKQALEEVIYETDEVPDEVLAKEV